MTEQYQESLTHSSPQNDSGAGIQRTRSQLSMYSTPRISMTEALVFLKITFNNNKRQYI